MIGSMHIEALPIDPAELGDKASSAVNLKIRTELADCSRTERIKLVQAIMEALEFSDADKLRLFAMAMKLPPYDNQSSIRSSIPLRGGERHDRS